MKVTNGSKALQGVHTESGVVWIAPGQFREVSLSEEGEALARRLPFLTLGEPVEAPKPLKASEVMKPASDKDKLIADLASHGVKADRRWSIEKLTEALEAATKPQ